MVLEEPDGSETHHCSAGDCGTIKSFTSGTPKATVQTREEDTASLAKVVVGGSSLMIALQDGMKVDDFASKFEAIHSAFLRRYLHWGRDTRRQLHFAGLRA